MLSLSSPSSLATVSHRIIVVHHRVTLSLCVVVIVVIVCRRHCHHRHVHHRHRRVRRRCVVVSSQHPLKWQRGVTMVIGEGVMW